MYNHDNHWLLLMNRDVLYLVRITFTEDTEEINDQYLWFINYLRVLLRIYSRWREHHSNATR